MEEKSHFGDVQVVYSSGVDEKGYSISFERRMKGMKERKKRCSPVIVFFIIGV